MMERIKQFISSKTLTVFLAGILVGVFLSYGYGWANYVCGPRFVADGDKVQYKRGCF